MVAMVIIAMVMAAMILMVATESLAWFESCDFIGLIINSVAPF